MTIDRTPQPQTAPAPAAWRCPFFTPAAAICQAALPHRTPPREVRSAVCGCGDYEDCTTFLARLLNSPQTRTR